MYLTFVLRPGPISPIKPLLIIHLSPSASLSPRRPFHSSTLCLPELLEAAFCRPNKINTSGTSFSEVEKSCEGTIVLFIYVSYYVFI